MERPLEREKPGGEGPLRARGWLQLRAQCPGCPQLKHTPWVGPGAAGNRVGVGGKAGSGGGGWERLNCCRVDQTPWARVEVAVVGGEEECTSERR